jgi:hypothetical protein
MVNSSLKNYLIVFLALTTLAGGALAWNQYRDAVKLRGQLLGGNGRADLEKRLRDLQKRRNELEAELAGNRSRRGGLPGSRGATAAAPAGEPDLEAARGGRGSRGAFLSNLMDNPEFSRLFADQQKSRVRSAFGPLCKRLNLTPEQTAQFQSLLAERQMTMMDALSAARAEGVQGRDAIGGVMQQATSQVDSQIQALLGPDGFAQYQDYVRTEPQRNQVNQLQTALVTTGNPPLQDFQVQQLTQILAQNSAANTGDGAPRGDVFFATGGGPSGSAVSGSTITPEAVAQAATVLTPVQQQALQQMQQEQATQRQIFSLMRQSFGAPGSAVARPVTATGSSGGSPPPPDGPPSG